MTKVAVIAHAGKSFGGGLRELRSELEHQGVHDPLWVVDGSDREKVKSFTIKVQPAAITICTPRDERRHDVNGSA